MDLTGKTCLVTGGAGFIGSHLVEKLLGMGCQVRAFIRYNSRNDSGDLAEVSSDRLDIHAGDLRDGEAVRAAMRGCQVVFHLGALIGIPYSYQNPREVIDTNVMGTLNVLSAAREMGVERVVHTSTSEVYGTARFVPITEDHPLQGQSPYSASKIAADKIAESFHAAFALPVATIRPFNVFGPRQSARAVIPTIIAQALSGDRVTLGALAPTRDFTFVADTVAAFAAVAAADAAVGTVVNVGSGFEISIGDLARRIGTLVGRDVVLDREERRLRPTASEVERLWADGGRARDLVGWRPAIDFDEGLRRTIAWVRDNPRRFPAGRYLR